MQLWHSKECLQKYESKAWRTLQRESLEADSSQFPFRFHWTLTTAPQLELTSELDVLPY